MRVDHFRPSLTDMSPLEDGFLSLPALPACGLSIANGQEQRFEVFDCPEDVATSCASGAERCNHCDFQPMPIRHPRLPEACLSRKLSSGPSSQVRLQFGRLRLSDAANSRSPPTEHRANRAREPLESPEGRRSPATAIPSHAWRLIWMKPPLSGRAAGRLSAGSRPRARAVGTPSRAALGHE